MDIKAMIDIKQGDCLELMKEIPDKSIDMILCDLPYGTTHNKWDMVIPLDKLWEQYKNIIKDNGAIVLFAQMPFAATLVNAESKLFRYEWVWHKTMATGFLNANKMPLRAHENILVFYKKLPTYNPQKTKGKPYVKGWMNHHTDNYGEQVKTWAENKSGDRYPVDVIKFSNGNHKSIHPTQKPVDLLEYLIKTYTNEGETVLDNCMGSGSTGVACLNTNRNFIGYELDTNYFNIAKERLEQHENKITIQTK